MVGSWQGGGLMNEAADWFGSQLTGAGMILVGPIEETRIRPWSVVLTARTNQGRYWFKANCPVLRFEAGLVSALSRLVPGRVLEPLAIDPGRGWMITPDGGRTLKEVGVTADAFERTLSEYGALQRAICRSEDDVIATGVPVVLPDQTSDRLERQLRELAALPSDHPLHVGDDVINRTAAVRRTLATAAEQLADVALPASLQHNDLHPGNAFVPADGESLRFFDFGDALWSHPFCVLHVALYRLVQFWGCSSDDVRITRLIDNYLDGWTDWAPISELRRLVEPAMTIARVHRYNYWHQLIGYMPVDELIRQADYAEALAAATSPE